MLNGILTQKNKISCWLWIIISKNREMHGPTIRQYFTTCTVIQSVKIICDVKEVGCKVFFISAIRPNVATASPSHFGFNIFAKKEIFRYFQYFLLCTNTHEYFSILHRFSPISSFTIFSTIYPSQINNKNYYYKTRITLILFVYTYKSYSIIN